MARRPELEKMADVIQNDQVGLVRIMPNTPVYWSRCYQFQRSQAVTDQQVTKVGQLLGAGVHMKLKKIDGSCSCWPAGCGPAFVLSDD